MYVVIVNKRAKKEIRRLPAKDQLRVLDAFDLLRSNPFEGKRLEGEYEGARSLRVWPYRILYTIQSATVTVTVLRVGHRQGVYGK